MCLTRIACDLESLCLRARFTLKTPKAAPRQACLVCCIPVALSCILLLVKGSAAPTCANLFITGRRCMVASSELSEAANALQLSTARSRTESCTEQEMEREQVCVKVNELHEPNAIRTNEV
eukprot:1156219-Pelagomonas_calceolata.AAC.2